MYVSELMLEVTRKCNLKCEHCLRGNAQNKSMTDDVIHETFQHIDHIHNLMLGGGEPTLAIAVIEKIYQDILWRDVQVDNVFLVTNGKTIKPQLLQVFNKLHRLCNDNEISGFAISNDIYHQKARGFYRSIDDYENVIYDASCSDDYDKQDLASMDIQLLQEHTNSKTNNWLARGRAKDWGTKTEDYLDALKLNDLHNPSEIYGPMYICYNGDVLGDENMCYLDMKKYVRGNICDFDNLMTNLKQSTIDNYNWCLHNCEYSSPDYESENVCNEWYECKNACEQIKNKEL